MAKIYRCIATNLNDKTLEELGFVFFPDTQILVKVVPQPLDSEPVKYLMRSFYENPKWIELFYNKNKKAIKDAIGLTYKKDGSIKMTKKFQFGLVSWMLIIDFNDDGWVGFTSYDPFDRKTYYSSETLRKYCGEDIDKMLELGFIEEFEYDENKKGD